MKKLFFNISFAIFAISLIITLITGLGPLFLPTLATIGSTVSHFSAGVALIGAILTLIALHLDKENHQGPPGPYLGG